jgi:hypothetical protein
MTQSRLPFIASRVRRVLLLAFPVLVVAAPGPVRADDVPSFRQGLWEYERGSGGHKYAATECLDPGEELRRQQIALQKMGCTLSPTTRAGSTWSYSADCTVKMPSGAMKFSRSSALTADSDNAYQVETRTTNQRGTVSEVITARRVADCTN